MMTSFLNKYLIYKIGSTKTSVLKCKNFNRILLNKPKKEIHSKYVFATKDIYDILNNLNVVKLLTMFMFLRKCRNGDYIGKCPICQETSKSTNNFRIHRKTRKFKCFSCGNSGNGIKFLMLIKKIPFDEAIILTNKLMYNDTKPLNVIGLKKSRHFKSNWTIRQEIVERVIPSTIGEDDDLPF